MENVRGRSRLYGLHRFLLRVHGYQSNSNVSHSTPTDSVKKCHLLRATMLPVLNMFGQRGCRNLFAHRRTRFRGAIVTLPRFTAILTPSTKVKIYLLTAPSGVTRVGDTRDGNWGCHPSIFSWKKTDDLFLLITVTFYWFHSGVTPPGGCHPAPFYLSDLVSPLFFLNLPINFFSGVTPWRVSPGAVRPLAPPLVTPLTAPKFG